MGHGAGERFLGRAKQVPCVGEADSLEWPGANRERHAQTKKPRLVQRGCLDYSSARECKENNQGQGKSPSSKEKMMLSQQQAVDVGKR